MDRPVAVITGGLGFIGLHLAERLLQDGYAVRAVDNLSAQIHGVLPAIPLERLQRPGLTVVRGDVRAAADLGRWLVDAEVLVHLAAETGTAQSMYEVSRYNAVNCQGTADLMDWLVNHPHRLSRVLLASSRSIYGEGAYQCPACGQVTPESRTLEALEAHQWEPACPSCGGALTLAATPESAPPRPASIYAATKLAQEDLVRIACQAMGIPATILRFQNVYGPGQSLNNPYTGILSIFSTRIRRGLNLPMFEDGAESRDFVHVGDVVQALSLCLAEPNATGGRTFNVGSGRPTSVLEVATLLNEALAGASPIEITGQFRLGDIRHCYADLKALRTATGFQPAIGLEEGLRGFAAWVLSQPLPEDRLDEANRSLQARGLMK